jgi:glycolate oxidase iron-sulfur subunit
MAQTPGTAAPFLSLREYEGLMRCVRCALCLPHCPTYRELRVETASPRGRLALMKSVADEVVAPDVDFTKHMHLCTDCRACEAACPSGVPFGALMEKSREKIERTRPKSLLGRLARFVGFRVLLPNPRLLDLFLLPLRLLHALRIRKPLQRARVLERLSPRLAELEQMLPDLPLKAPGPSLPPLIPPAGPMRARVALFTGCVMQSLFSTVNRDTAEVLRQNGCEVIVPRDQGCCGALHIHEGRRSDGARLALRNLQGFRGLELDAVIANAAGCGAVLKEYGVLFQDEPALAEEAAEFGSKQKDVMEFLDALGVVVPPNPVRLRVHYDAPCHLVHAQGVDRAPVDVLSRLPGVEMVEGPDTPWCCGSAGIYNLTHPELSREMLDRKMKTIIPLDPDVITSGNPGCMMQLRLGVARWGLRAEVRHPVELLARGYRRAP